MRNRKNGVAVIIVLGLLALLMVLGVAFSVSMRVERAGAANYASAAKTRQVVWAGLARAIGEINAETPNAYPPGDFLASGGSGWDSSAGGGVRLLTGNATNYVPDVFLDAGFGDERSAWLSMGSSGYAAYMVLNLSDMLDLHYVGGETRAGGTNAAELVLDGIGIDTNLLVKARRLDGPFETLAEFKALYPDIPATFLSEYSRYLSDTNRTTAIYMGTSVSEITANKTEILAAMLDILGVRLLDAANQDRWFDYLLDYLEDSPARWRPDGPNAKPVPLLNEVAPADGALTPKLTTTTLSGELAIEVWNPSMTNRPFVEYKVVGDVSSTVALTDDLGTIGASPYIYTNRFEGRPFTIATNQVRISAIPVFPSGRGGISITWPVVDVSTNNPQATINIEVSNLQVVQVADGTPVDSAADVDFTFGYRGNYVVGPVFTNESWQALDPRINWFQSAWTNAPKTIGVVNAGQEGKRVYASETGFLYSPLELGHLLCLGVRAPSDRTGLSEWAPWREFQVYGPGRHPLLEHLTTLDTDVRRGLVNANTAYPKLLETAFTKLPFPAPAAASAAADYLVAISATNLFGQLTDVLDLDWRADLAGSLALNDVEWDALLASSIGLMGVRQNLFLIVVSASAAGDGMGELKRGEVTFRGRQRALALVWRDPVPKEVETPNGGTQKLYDCFIREFMWLD